MRLKIILLAILTASLSSLVTKAQNKNPPERLAYLGVNVKYDATVVNVLPHSPAQKAGIRPGDVITAIRGEAVHNDIELHHLMLSRRPGEKVSISVWRRPIQRLAFEVTLIERAPELFKTMPRYDVLEWNGPDNPQYYQYGGGYVTAYYFTATWCAPCRELRPQIEKIYKQFNQIPEFRLVAVAISDGQDDREEYQALVKLQRRGHYPFTVMRDTSIWENTDITTVPTIIIINQRGFIVGEYHGQDLLPDKCATLIKELKLILSDPNPANLAWL